MLRIPDYTHNLSLRISRVMDEIGVNEKIVMKRRKTLLLLESSHTLSLDFLRDEFDVYYFGSQSEGTTTPGLNSDIDCLITLNLFNVIQDVSEWEHGKQNYLMTQDESVSPGYCLLQELRHDVPLPAVYARNKNLFRDGMGRIMFKNTFIDGYRATGRVRHGPAQSKQGGPGIYNADYVFALPCPSFPMQARLDQHREGYWPSDEMIQYCHNAGCFVVAVGEKGSENEELEWRISTSLAERCLMFNLNITQIRCYVLMKMIIKTFITPQYSESISSFMCKTVLLHCISKTRSDEWKDSTLLYFLSFCLSTLYNCVSNEYCPHFLNPGNNLMMRRFSQVDKHYILEALSFVIKSNGRALFEIECDGICLRLFPGLNRYIAINLPLPYVIAGYLLKETALQTSSHLNNFLYEIRNLSSRNALRMMSSIMKTLNNTQHIHIESKFLIARQLYSTFGFILASSSIDRRDTLSYNSHLFMSLGLYIDVAVVKLKRASVYYCLPDIEMTEMILKDIEECYDLSVVEPICGCHLFKHASSRKQFDVLCYESNQELTLLKHITASCVRFLLCEMKNCPYELRYEMFRSTQEDLSYRTNVDRWMDMAVIDSLPYLYFLQYKTYSRLGKEEERRNALSNLKRTIKEERNLGHKETALNLLGQCMEIEQCQNNAIKYYMLSLKIRQRNNAAKLLICRLICNVINRLQR